MTGKTALNMKFIYSVRKKAMMINIRNLLIVLLFALSPLRAGAEVAFVSQTHDGFLNLRAGPGTGYDIIHRLYPGDRVEILEAHGKWRRITSVSNSNGWVHGRYLLIDTAPNVEVLYVKQTTDGFLNLRSGPGTSHSVIQKMSTGKRLIVRRQQGKWKEVSLSSGTSGWAHGGYMTATQPQLSQASNAHRVDPDVIKAHTNFQFEESANNPQDSREDLRLMIIVKHGFASVAQIWDILSANAKLEKMISGNQYLKT